MMAEEVRTAAVSAQLLRIGSRGSQLALWQANHIAEALRQRGHMVEIEIIKTTGDRMQDPAFAAAQREAAGQSGAGADLDGKGIFIKEIEEALAAGRIDLAVHSLKDLPTELDSRFVLAAIPERADARDVLVMAANGSLETLKQGARVGTTSPRRQAQLRRLRADFEFVEMRGNVDTRLRKLAEGQADALVLAAAGLDRLQRSEWVRHRFAPDEICPAPGQGALAIEARAGDARAQQALQCLEHAETRFCVEAERTALHALGGGCSVPIGAYCVAENGPGAPAGSDAPAGPDRPAGSDGSGGPGGRWRMWGCVVARDATRGRDGQRRAFVDIVVDRSTDALTLGSAVAAQLMEQGAGEMLR